MTECQDNFYFSGVHLRTFSVTTFASLIKPLRVLDWHGFLVLWVEFLGLVVVLAGLCRFLCGLFFTCLVHDIYKIYQQWRDTYEIATPF
jgi:hypothetical protein